VTVYLFSGTPGSGKTLHAVERGLAAQRRRGGVLANFEITKAKRWAYVREDEMTPELLQERAMEWIDSGRESQALVIVDEAHRILNSRTWNDKGAVAGRLALLRFLSEHRHYGYDVILVAQSDIMLDKQARPLIEVEVKHFKLNQRYWWLPLPVFMRVEKWYGMPHMKGKLDFVFMPIGRGRYDHQAMGKRMRAALEAKRSRPPAAVDLRGVGHESDHDGRTFRQQVAQLEKPYHSRVVALRAAFDGNSDEAS
jgi:zona occludens toxin